MDQIKRSPFAIATATKSGGERHVEANPLVPMMILFNAR